MSAVRWIDGWRNAQSGPHHRWRPTPTAAFAKPPPSLPAALQMNKVSLHPSEIKKLGKNLIQVGWPASGCLL